MTRQAVENAPQADDDAGLPTLPQMGDIVAAKYRIGAVLGQGAMGTVFEARHVALDKRVAVKFVAPALANQKHVRARFAREALASARIQSPCVMDVYDVDETHDGLPYIVMERLRGRTLADLVREKGRFDLDTGIKRLLEICKALGPVHDSGVVHRDLKPENIFVCDAADPGATPQIKIIDFGASKLMDGGNRRTTSELQAATLDTARLNQTIDAGVIPPGTPVYMPPEAFVGSATESPVTDVWAFGIIACEMLTGMSPFSGHTLEQLAININTEEPEIDASLPPALVTVLKRCLYKDPKGRFQSIQDVGRALMAFRDDGASVSQAKGEPGASTGDAGGALDALLDSSPGGSLRGSAKPSAKASSAVTPRDASGWRLSLARGGLQRRPKLWILGVVLLATLGLLASRVFVKRVIPVEDLGKGLAKNLGKGLGKPVLGRQPPDLHPPFGTRIGLARIGLARIGLARSWCQACLEAETNVETGAWGHIKTARQG